MVLNQGQEAVVQQSSRLVHAPVHLDTQGLILKSHGVKGEVDPPVVHSVAALQGAKQGGRGTGRASARWSRVAGWEGWTHREEGRGRLAHTHETRSVVVSD